MKNEGFSAEVAGTITGAELGFLTAILYVENFVPPNPTYGCGMDTGFALIGASFLGIIAGATIGCILGAIFGAVYKPNHF